MNEKFMKPKVRRARSDDLGSIAELLESVSLPAQGMKENLDNFIVLMLGTSLIGTAGLEIYGDKGLLRSLAVHPDYRNRGYGKQVYHRILKNVYKQNLSELYLLTETAERFFAELGFEKIAREAADEQVKTSEEFRSLCPDTAVCMRLKLR